MSLTVSNNYTDFWTYNVRDVSVSAGHKKDVARVGGREADTDTVQLSGRGRLAASGLLDGLILPTKENVCKLSATLSQDLAGFLGEMGVSANPPVEFTVDSLGEIRINGDRPDKDRILQAVKGNEKIAQEIRNVTAIASHAAAIAESLKFQEEYRASNDPESIVARYSHLFSPTQRYHQISLAYDRIAINVLTDGKVWLSLENIV